MARPVAWLAVRKEQPAGRTALLTVEGVRTRDLGRVVRDGAGRVVALLSR